MVLASFKESRVTLNVNEGTFRGLSKQNLLFHQCIWELVDNAIAAKKIKRIISYRYMYGKKRGRVCIHIYC